MKYFLILFLLSFNCFANDNYFLVLDPNGKQLYLERVHSYNDESKILYKGILTPEQKDAVGALVIRNGVVSINQELYERIKQERIKAEQEKIIQDQIYNDAKIRLKECDLSVLNNCNAKDLFIIMKRRM